MNQLGVFVTALAAITGCASSLATTPPVGTTVPIMRFRAEPYSFSYNSGMDQPARLVVRDDATWRELWSKIHNRQTPIPAVPAVDFSQEIIVIAALGSRATGGYSILLEKAVEDGRGATEVTVRSISPGTRCGVTQAVTQPVDVARLQRRNDTIRFVERSEVTDC